jgi:hypothetical protein
MASEAKVQKKRIIKYIDDEEALEMADKIVSANKPLMDKLAKL